MPTQAPGRQIYMSAFSVVILYKRIIRDSIALRLKRADQAALRKLSKRSALWLVRSSVMAFRMFLVFLAFTMVVHFSGNCSAQNFICTLVPCPPGKVRKHVCLSWSRTSGEAECREAYCISFMIMSLPLSTLHIKPAKKNSDSPVICARIRVVSNIQLTTALQSEISALNGTFLFVSGDRQMIRLLLVTETSTWRISDEVETG